MKHLKVFETTAAFETVRATLDTPNVSLIEATSKINYLPYMASAPVDPYNNHAYVEIGGLKWATMNVGANSITDKGLFYQWGDTQGYASNQVGSGSGQKIFDKDNGSYDSNFESYYKYCDYDSVNEWAYFTKYNSTDNKTTLDATDDAAAAAWGGNWRMPTKAEFESLIENTSQEWSYGDEDYNNTGVAGLMFGTYDEHDEFVPLLFFPEIGYYDETDLNDNAAYYWSKTVDTGEGCDAAYVLNTESSSPNIVSASRYYGILIRPVAD